MGPGGEVSPSYVHMTLMSNDQFSYCYSN
jgi:hypothetical protein